MLSPGHIVRCQRQYEAWDGSKVAPTKVGDVGIITEQTYNAAYGLMVYFPKHQKYRMMDHHDIKALEDF